MGLEQAQRLVERSLAGLGPMTGNLCCVPAHPDLDCPALRGLGFACVKTGDFSSLSDCPESVEAMLVVSVGTDVSAATEVIQTLNQSQSAPAILAVIIVPFFSSESPLAFDSRGYGPATGTAFTDSSDPVACITLGRDLADSRAVLFEAGADDAVCLFAGETLKAYRIMEVIQKSEFMAKKMSEIIDTEVAAVEEKAARKVQTAYRKFLMVLPGRVLENIPYENAELEEHHAEDGTLLQVGDYDFVAKIGAGAFGHVYKAEHREHRTTAVKVISKSSVKNASILFSLDRELCLMLYMDPHPNVVKALGVMHGQYNFYAVMEYAGRWHLQKFTKAVLERTGGSSLPQDLVASFTAQQADALSHLHASMVCHRDLKPDNWIVNDTGDALRLADFGLAMQVCSPVQPLKQSCGSLPFCAPEVFSSEEKGKESPGYDGMAADIWSLAVNYMELLEGPYSIEKLLGWMPRHPTDKGVVLSGLQSLPDRWDPAANEDNQTLCATITHMLVLRPEHRWKIGQVRGIQGLALPHEVRVPRPGVRKRYLRGHFPSNGSTSRKSDADGLSVPAVDQEGAKADLLTERLGGATGVSAAFDQMLDRFLFTPGFGDIFESKPEQLPLIRTFFAQEMPGIFDAAPGSTQEQAIRTRLVEALCGTFVSDAHFSMLAGQLAVALRHLEVEEPAIEEALARFRCFAPDFTAPCVARLADAHAKNTSPWRASVLAAARRPHVAAFAACLADSISRSPVLSQTQLQSLNAVDFESHFLRFLGAADGEPAGPVPLPVGLPGTRGHLALVHAAREALSAAAGWAPEVVETLHFVMLEEWQRAHADLSGSPTSPADHPAHRGAPC